MMFNQTIQTVAPQKLQTNKTLSESSIQDMLDSFTTIIYFKRNVQLEQVFSEKSLQSYLKERQNALHSMVS